LRIGSGECKVCAKAQEQKQQGGELGMHDEGFLYDTCATEQRPAFNTHGTLDDQTLKVKNLHQIKNWK